MSRYILLILSLFVWFPGTSNASNQETQLVAAGARLQKLHDGFAFLEGPAADAQGNLYFSDIPSNRILRWGLGGELTTVIADSNGGNGLAFDNHGNLIFCEGLGKRISMLQPDGARIVLAETYNGEPLNSPNDIWVDSEGGIYFTDPNYAGSDNLTQDGQHVYYLDPDRQNLQRVTSDLRKPNGIITTPASDRLYVADTDYDQVFLYQIINPGELGSRQAFADTAADGITLDEQGNLYTAWEGEIKIFNPHGQLIETIPMPERPTNLAFGGEDHQTLFITGRQSLYAIEMAVRGVPKQFH